MKMSNDKCPMTKEFPSTQMIWSLVIGASLDIGPWTLVINKRVRL